MRAFDRLIDEAPGPHEAIIAIAGEQGRDEHPPTCLRRAPILVNSEEALGDEREVRERRLQGGSCLWGPVPQHLVFAYQVVHAEGVPHA